MGSARIALVPQLVLVIGAIGDDVAAILLAKLQLPGVLGGLLLPEEHVQQPIRGRAVTTVWPQLQTDLVMCRNAFASSGVTRAAELAVRM